jgi:hypothetical protein
MKSFVEWWEETFDEVCEGEGIACEHAHDVMQYVWSAWEGSQEAQDHKEAVERRKRKEQVEDAIMGFGGWGPG